MMRKSSPTPEGGGPQDSPLPPRGETPSTWSWWAFGRLVLSDLLHGRFKVAEVGSYYVVKTHFVCRRMHRALMALPIHKRRFAVAELQRIMEER